MGRGILFYGAASRESFPFYVSLFKAAGRCASSPAGTAVEKEPGSAHRAPAPLQSFLKESNRPAKPFHLSFFYFSGWPACPAFPFHRPARARRGFVTFQLVELS